MNRRALLAGFLAAPAVVRLSRWSKPAPIAPTDILAGYYMFSNMTPAQLTYDDLDLEMMRSCAPGAAGYPIDVRPGIEAEAAWWAAHDRDG